MLQEISYYLLFGRPVILYLGILTFLALLLTAAIAVLNKTGIRTIPFAWHVRCAVVTIALALVHGALGVLAYI